MSAAAMATRATRKNRGGLDFAPTHPWATRALCEWLQAAGHRLDRQTCREPAAGAGHMARPLAEYFGKVLASDIADYGQGYRRADYLNGRRPPRTAWTVTNPPFDDCRIELFAQRALGLSDEGVAIFAPLRFAETIGRYERLFAVRPPTEILQFVERVPILMGRIDPEATTATAYSWFVWRACPEGQRPTHFHWLAPCEGRLKRASDY